MIWDGTIGDEGNEHLLGGFSGHRQSYHSTMWVVHFKMRTLRSPLDAGSDDAVAVEVFSSSAFDCVMMRLATQVDKLDSFGGVPLLKCSIPRNAPTMACLKSRLYFERVKT